MIIRNITPFALRQISDQFSCYNHNHQHQNQKLKSPVSSDDGSNGTSQNNLRCQGLSVGRRLMCCEIYFVLLQILLLNLAWKHCVTIIGISGVGMMFLEMLCQVSPGIVINLKIIIIISDNSCCAMHVRSKFRAKNAANVLLRNFAESCYWSQLPQLSYYKSENWFPSILRLPYLDWRTVFSNSQLIIPWSPREPGTTGVSILSFYCSDVLRQPLWNHHEHQYTGTPWGSSGDNRLSDISYEYHLVDHKNSHISTFISQHRLDCRQCLAEDWTDILRLRKIYILFEIFLLFRASLQPRGEKCNS